MVMSDIHSNHTYDFVAEKILTVVWGRERGRKTS